MVVVGQPRAVRLAVRDWRREPRHTALGGLLAGTLAFAWHRAADTTDPSREWDEADAIEHLWGGLLAG